MDVQASWLDEADPHATVPMLLVGTMSAGSPRRPLAAIRTMVVTLRGYPVGNYLELDIADEQGPGE